jgi:type I restriction enzyme R subunit
MIDKKTLSEQDICTKFITPAIEKSGWDKLTQLLEEVSFTDGKIYVRGKLTARGARKRADYILYYKPNIRSLCTPCSNCTTSYEQSGN